MVTVLVAEVDQAERELIAFRLEAAGYTVRTCGTGLTALNAIGRDIAAMVVEQQLPGLDGLEVCRLVRADPATADLPVMMLSHTATEDEVVAAFAVGADDWLAEPAGIHDIRTRLTGLLDRCYRHPHHHTTPDHYRPRHARSSEC